VGYENEFGFAAHYRKAVESGRVKMNEHACYTVISALRAAVYGIPFMPVKGLVNSELIEANDYFCLVQDPFSGETVAAVKSIIPDFVLIHCEEADENGNFALQEPFFEDLLLARAAKKLIVSAERIVHPARFGSYVKGEFPGFLVSAVVHAPHGAAPCSFPGIYSIDPAEIRAFKAVKDRETLLKSLGRRERGHP
jgi:glutaconate CoA-transferase subunit A